MEKTDITQLFTQEVKRDSDVSIVWDFSNCKAFPKEKHKALIRTRYVIDNPSEEILFFCNPNGYDYNQGLVLTNQAAYLIEGSDSNEVTRLFFWSQIDNVTYKDETMYFWLNEQVEGSLPLDYFCVWKRGRRYAENMAAILNKIAHAAAKNNSLTYDEFADTYNNLESVEDKKKCAIEAYELMPEGSFEELQVLITLAELMKDTEDYKNAAVYFGQAASHPALDVGSKLYGEMCRELFECFIELDDIEAVRCWSLEAGKYDDDTETFTDEDGNKITHKEYATDIFKKANAYYVEHFLELPFESRRVLFLSDDVDNLLQSEFAVIAKSADLSALSFPAGHPKANTMYVAHPKQTSRYLPIESYQIDLLEDRLREFSLLAQSLGATSVTISSQETTGNLHGSTKGKGASIGASANGIGVAVKNNKEYSEWVYEEIGHRISLKQKYQPIQKPFVPEGMLWYDSEPSWQRLARQRMEGNLLEHSEKIESCSSQIVSNEELKKIGLELKSVYGSIGLAFGKKEENVFGEQFQTSLTVSIRFASTETLTEPAVSDTPQQKKPLDEEPSNPEKEQSSTSASKASIDNIVDASAEQKYLDEVRFCLSEGEITSIGRRLLDKTQASLGISKERALELEESILHPRLTEEEEEYRQAYSEAIADGVVSSTNRKLLERLSALLGITPERAAEIEAM